MEICTLVLGSCATNVYIIIEGGDAVVIDPAENAEYIAEYINRKNATLKYILLTHGHFDHVSAVGELQKRGARVVISDADYACFKDGTLNAIFGADVDPFESDIMAADGDVLQFIGHTFKVISTAGHTRGSVCYILDDEIIFSGDTLFYASVGRTDFTYGNKSELYDSVKKLYGLPHDYKIFAGHGQPTTLDYERKNNPYVRC